ncbi:MAG: hypothetical protein WCI54_08730 [Bacteroidia bacterium]
MYEEDNIESEFLKHSKANPFRTPDHYFDTVEDRIMERIEQPTITKTKSFRIIRYLKPVLGLAASLSIVYLLVYYSTNTPIVNSGTKTAVAVSSPSDLLDNYSLNLTSIDDNTLASALFSEEANNVVASNPDEVLAYLAADLNDVEIYSEIQN